MKTTGVLFANLGLALNILSDEIIIN